MRKGTHAIERTSPMGGKFIGRCLLCGTEGLTSSDALKECPGSSSAEQSILAAIDEPATPPQPPVPEAADAQHLPGCVYDESRPDLSEGRCAPGCPVTELSNKAKAVPEAGGQEREIEILAKRHADLYYNGATKYPYVWMAIRDAIVAAIARLPSPPPPAEQQPMKTKPLDRFGIMREFREGMACAIGMTPAKHDGSEYWTAGWRAGRSAAHDFGNQYLVSIGREPMGIVQLASAPADQGQAAPQQGGGIIETREEMHMVVIQLMGIAQSIDEQRCPDGFNDASDLVARLTGTIRHLKGWPR